MYSEMSVEELPTGPLTFKLTEYFPGSEYTCETELELVFVEKPSPKSHVRLATVPADVSVNVTVRGLSPEDGRAVKDASGAKAPDPVREFVLLPALEEITTALLKVPTLVGRNASSRFVELNPERLKGEPEMMLNGPVPTEAVPFVIGAPPKFVSTNTLRAFVPAPASTIPKSRELGETARSPGVNAEPRMEFVLFPPLLWKSRLLLKVPASVGLKTTAT
jgi:hypothetical protein